MKIEDLLFNLTLILNLSDKAKQFVCKVAASEIHNLSDSVSSLLRIIHEDTADGKLIAAMNRIDELEKQCEKLRLDYMCATRGFRGAEAERGMDRRVIELLRIIQQLYNEECTDYGTGDTYNRIVGEMEKSGYDMTTLKM